MTVFWSQDFMNPTWLGKMHQAWLQSFLNTNRNVLLIAPGVKVPFEFHGIDVIRPPLNIAALPQFLMALEKKSITAVHFLDPQQGLASLLFQLGLIGFSQIKNFVTTITFLNAPGEISKRFFSGVAPQVDAVFYSHPESLRRLQGPKVNLKQIIHTSLPVPEETESVRPVEQKDRVVVPGPFHSVQAAIEAVSHLAYDSRFQKSEFVFCHGFEGLGPKDKKFVIQSPVFQLIQSRLVICEHSDPERDLSWLKSSRFVELRHLNPDHIHHQVFQQLGATLKLETSVMPGTERELSSSGDVFGNFIQRWYSQIEWQKKTSPNTSTSASSPKNFRS